MYFCIVYLEHYVFIDLNSSFTPLRKNEEIVILRLINFLTYGKKFCACLDVFFFLKTKMTVILYLNYKRLVKQKQKSLFGKKNNKYSRLLNFFLPAPLQFSYIWIQYHTATNFLTFCTFSEFQFPLRISTQTSYRSFFYDSQ